jgi:SAM-dependent methyltransferase
VVGGQAAVRRSRRRARGDNSIPIGDDRRHRLPAKPGHAFGVDPFRPQYWSLRQSRYDALAQDVSDWAAELAAGETLSLLDIGCGTGVLLRHFEHKENFERLAISGADLSKDVYRRDLYRELYLGDLCAGYPEIPSNAFDVVICEQVLEHLPTLEHAVRTLERVLKPGGRLIVGVPIFLPPLCFIRRHMVGKIDRIFQPRRSRGHLQAFTVSSFLDEFKKHSHLRVLKVRGFRIISGGLLRPLENYRWWWKLNRRLGELIPGTCIEIQAIMTKDARSYCSNVASDVLPAPGDSI